MTARPGLVLALSFAASAHEIGTTRVHAVFHESRAYEITIVTDAGSLREKLEAMGGPAPQAELESRFRRRVKIDFGQAAADPKIAYKVAGPQATITMTGQVPAGANRFTWT